MRTPPAFAQDFALLARGGPPRKKRTVAFAALEGMQAAEARRPVSERGLSAKARRLFARVGHMNFVSILVIESH